MVVEKLRQKNSKAKKGAKSNLRMLKNINIKEQLRKILEHITKTDTRQDFISLIKNVVT